MARLDTVIDRLLLGKDLTRAGARGAFRVLFTHPEKRGHFGKPFLVLLQKKGEIPEELYALVTWIRSQEKKYKTGRIPYLADGCGTGGDGTHTFNISTLACLVAAGAGAHVAKHGNRGVSSKCGSADLLDALGVHISAPYRRMMRSLRHGGMGYFHAPLYHPMFRAIQPLRSELGKKRIKTIFNLAGPLLNPLRIKRQAIGVFRKDFVPVIARAAQMLKMDRAFIFWNSQGLDELGTSGHSTIAELKGGRLNLRTVTPSSLGLKKAHPSSLAGGTPKRNARIARRILSGKEKGVKRDVVLLNAAAVLWASGKANSLKEGLGLAQKSLDSGRAQQALSQLIRASHAA